MNVDNKKKNNRKVDRRKLPVKWAKVCIESEGREYLLTVEGGNLVFSKDRICLQVEVWKGDIDLPGKGKKRITVEPEKYGLGSNTGVCDKDIVTCNVNGQSIEAQVVFILENVLRGENAWFVERADGKRFPLKSADHIRVIGSKLKTTHSSSPPPKDDGGQKQTHNFSDGTLHYYTDGSATSNPGPCGAAYCVFDGSACIDEKSIPIGMGTNNIGELIAIREAMKDIIDRNPDKAVIYSDSQYVIKGICEWSDNWQKNGWKTSGGNPVKNVELFKEILSLRDECSKMVKLELKWVKGHDENPGNERADQLALRAATEAERNL